MTILGRSEELVSRCVECDLAEPESLASLGGSAPGVVDGILSWMKQQCQPAKAQVDLRRRQQQQLKHLNARPRTMMKWKALHQLSRNLSFLKGCSVTELARATQSGPLFGLTKQLCQNMGVKSPFAPRL